MYISVTAHSWYNNHRSNILNHFRIALSSQSSWNRRPNCMQFSSRLFCGSRIVQKLFLASAKCVLCKFLCQVWSSDCHCSNRRKDRFPGITKIKENLKTESITLYLSLILEIKTKKKYLVARYRCIPAIPVHRKMQRSLPDT